MNSEDRSRLEVLGQSSGPMGVIGRVLLDIDRELHKPVTDKPTQPPDGTWIPEPDRRPEGLNDGDIIESRTIEGHNASDSGRVEDTYAWGNGYEYRVLMREGQVAVWPDELVAKLKMIRPSLRVGSSREKLLQEVIDALTTANQR
jgi:hypothetical protein